MGEGCVVKDVIIRYSGEDKVDNKAEQPIVVSTTVRPLIGG